MSRVILFSPVGGTDPIPQTNMRDGSLLHICRVYRPSDVHLYLSAEMLALHRADNRYLYCLERLDKLQGRTTRYHLIERPELCDVQLFDGFYEEFRQIIRGIASDMEKGDTLLLNVSSGTPAMKSALLVLTTLGEYPCKLVQVRTPAGKMNEHRHEGYDVETLWELDEDNAEPFENRCQEIRCPSLSLIKQGEIIKSLVLAYDYEAARQAAALLPKDATASYLPWLELACARAKLDFAGMNKLDKEIGSGCIPVKAHGKQERFEYALNLAVKQKRKEYADFIRGITPLIADLLEMILAHECKFDVRKFCEPNKRVWDRDKLRQNAEIAETLDLAFHGEFRYGAIYSSHLAPLISYLANGNSKLTGLVETLRKVESKVRNLAAHEIVSLSDDSIRRLTGYDSAGIMERLRQAFQYTDIGLAASDWDAYEQMNEAIIRHMP